MDEDILLKELAAIMQDFNNSNMRAEFITPSDLFKKSEISDYRYLRADLSSINYDKKESKIIFGIHALEHNAIFK